jgi:hypothetical protein
LTMRGHLTEYGYSSARPTHANRTSTIKDALKG